ncbi:hypothetical protein [Streptomyces sp. NPDC018693]|uniref:hypothetical protein n=1 Tax=unclassified Streptomyces TaxID=2593676 RepID=UPI0037A4C284
MLPIDTRDPAAAARAYLRLEWPLSLGHRYRPRQGCTCDDADCPTPGAHPLPEAWPLHCEDAIDRALDTMPGAALIAATERFDALILPHRIGMAAMIQLDRITPVPCLFYGRCAALLVMPATGRYAAVREDVEVRTGRDAWIALPPSHDIRWDTPPWIEPTEKPRPLMHGRDVGEKIAEVFDYSAGYRNDRAEAVR